jgi:two-component sensor histidine kinase
MSLGLLPEDILAVLTSQRLDPQWVLSVWDRNDVIVARTRNHDTFVGKPLPTRLQADQWPNGVSRSSSLDDESVIRAVAKSVSSGWRVSVSVPIAIAEHSLRRSMWFLAAVSAVSLFLAGLFGYLLGRPMSGPIAQAAANAEAFGTNRNIELETTFVAEVNDLLSALKNAADRQGLLSEELNHRCKNILAVVKSIVERSLGDGRSLAEARSVAMARLQALARAHDLVLKYEWRGTDLKEIAQAELGPFGERVEIEGPAITLEPELVQPFMLVFHELATNAAKYGALSTPQGRVRLSWIVTANPGELSMVWRESGGPKVADGSSKGFGSRLLERGVPRGIATLDYDRAGFSYRLKVALSVMTPDEKAKSQQSGETDDTVPSTNRP